MRQTANVGRRINAGKYHPPNKEEEKNSSLYEEAA